MMFIEGLLQIIFLLQSYPWKGVWLQPEGVCFAKITSWLYVISPITQLNRLNYFIMWWVLQTYSKEQVFHKEGVYLQQQDEYNDAGE